MNQTVHSWVPTAKKKNQGIWASFGVALIIEVGMVLAVLAWVLMHPPKALEQVIPLVISMLDTPKENKPAPLPPPPEPPKLQKTPTNVPKVATPAPAPVPELKPVEEAPLPAVVKPNAFTVPSTPAPPSAPAVVAPPPPPPAPTVDPALAYNVKLAAAVQLAFVVPGPASALGFKGRARVEFHLKDGVAGQVKIIQVSGLGAVDRAAIKAVETAVFPAPPAALAGKEGVYQIWVACY